MSWFSITLYLEQKLSRAIVDKSHRLYETCIRNYDE